MQLLRPTYLSAYSALGSRRKRKQAHYYVTPPQACCEQRIEPGPPSS